MAIEDWTTAAQRRSIETLARRSPELTYEDIADTASPMIGGGGAIAVQYGSIWVAIETDGYRHT